MWEKSIFSEIYKISKDRSLYIAIYDNHVEGVIQDYSFRLVSPICGIFLTNNNENFTYKRIIGDRVEEYFYFYNCDNPLEQCKQWLLEVESKYPTGFKYPTDLYDDMKKAEIRQSYSDIVHGVQCIKWKVNSSGFNIRCLDDKIHVEHLKKVFSNMKINDIKRGNYEIDLYFQEKD